MNDQHPITPPPELVREWATWRNATDEESFWRRIATAAARWGADQELEACRMEIIDGAGRAYIDETRDRVRLADDIWSVRRPKPPTLNELALQMLGTIERDAHYLPEITDTIRCALEALPRRLTTKQPSCSASPSSPSSHGGPND